MFYYIYAVFYSPNYRSRYAEFLKIDFPRLPLASNKQLFTDLSAIGEQLVQLHLMTSLGWKPPLTPPWEGGEKEEEKDPLINIKEEEKAPLIKGLGGSQFHR